MKKFNIFICVLCAFCILLPFSGCKSNPKVQEKRIFGYFNTVSVIYSYADDTETEFSENCREVEAILEKYHRLFDIYNEYDGINNLCTVNKNAGSEPIAVDGELIDFLLYAKELYHTTKGEMNVMMGSVLSIWHDCREDKTVPDSYALRAAAEYTSIDLLEIDEINKTVRISVPHASIDVGAVGKGYATEKAAQYLKNKGVNSYVLDVGGNIRIIGSKPDGGGFITGIKDPHDTGKFAEKLTLSDTSCVTSGDYERYFEVDDVRYHHIIDIDTLYPANHFSSVTVICEDSGLADALSTALFCMTLADGRNLVTSLDGVEVVWVTKYGAKLTTDGIDEMRYRQ